MEIPEYTPKRVQGVILYFEVFAYMQRTMPRYFPSLPYI